MQIPDIDKETACTANPWKPSDGVEPCLKVIDGRQISYQTFFQDIQLRNQLCLIGPEVTRDWASRQDWRADDGGPDFNYLLSKFGDQVAPVANCNSQEFSAHPKSEMTVRDYVTYWQTYRSQNYPSAADCLYLKDWHFVRDVPAYHAYSPPHLVCSDWMNEFWDVWKKQQDDYRFVYMGPRGSWTPFHSDVLSSYSWSANICGKKKWIFYPPGTEQFLKDKHGQLVFDLRSPDLEDMQKYPHAAKVRDAAITVIQNPGEIIFVPSGWHHQVFNLEDTISINHNWINGCNAHLSWEHIKMRLKAVQAEIKDCRDMEGWDLHCQVMLKADCGMDFVDFFNFLATVATHRLQLLKLCRDRPVGPSLDTASLSPSSVSRPANCTKGLLDKEDLDEKSNQDCGKEPEVDKFVFGDKDFEIVKDLNIDNKSICHICKSSACTLHALKTSKKENVIQEDSTLVRLSNSCCPSLSSGDNKNVYNTQESARLICNSFIARNAESNSVEQRKVSRFLCLFKGVVVDGSADVDVSFQDKSQQSGESSPCVSADVNSSVAHDLCPHWAHCGFYLAVFDLRQVRHILQDMRGQDEFNVIMADQSCFTRTFVSVANLILEIEQVLHDLIGSLDFTS